MEMDRDSFAEQVMSRVGNMLGGGHDIRIHRAGKNNGVYRTGLQITGNGLDIAPVIYIDRYYGLYEKGEETIDSVAARVMDTYNRERRGGMMQVDMRKFLSYDRVRENYRIQTGQYREEQGASGGCTPCRFYGSLHHIPVSGITGRTGDGNNTGPQRTHEIVGCDHGGTACRGRRKHTEAAAI